MSEMELMNVRKKNILLDAIDWLLARSAMMRESFRSIHSSTVVLFCKRKNTLIKKSLQDKINTNPLTSLRSNVRSKRT